ncbi:MAG TPA: hypothetical protein VFY36_06685 [Solirubrobacteraceae bacterium]|nr:hypothetical protein [Solirubrobacteraceae bacterium]
MQISRRDLADLLRSVSAILLAIGALVSILRKATNDDLSDLSLFLLLIVPAVALYGLALLEAGDSHSDDDDNRARPAIALPSIAAILLGTGAMFAFLKLAGADTHHKLYAVAVLTLGGLIAAHTTARLRVAYAALLAGAAALLVWQLVWELILPHASSNATRWLLVLAAALLLAVAARLARAAATGSRELAIVGGFAAVLAGVQGVIAGALNGGAELIESSGGPHLHGLHDRVGSPQSFGWDLYLLVVSTLLVWLAARSRARGLGYVGAFGLLAFVVSAGVQITQFESGESASGALVGWPLALLLLGAAGLAAPRLLRDDQ